MPSPKRTAVPLFLAAVWCVATLACLMVISALIVGQPRFPLNFGVIRTVGRAGLSVTLLPALVGLSGLLLLARRRSLAATLLAFYSFFWAGVLASGFPAIWNARRSFCLNALNFCIVSPWVSRVTLFALVLPFLLSGVCFYRLLRGRETAALA